MAQVSFLPEQPEMVLAGANPPEPLYFSVSKSGRYLIDYYRGLVFEIRGVWHDARLEWGASVRIANSETIVARGEFHQLGDALDYLQAEARRRGAPESASAGAPGARGEAGSQARRMPGAPEKGDEA